MKDAEVGETVILLNYEQQPAHSPYKATHAIFVREGRELLPNVEQETDVYDASVDADLVVILTEWNEFRALDLPRLAMGMASARMADLRNIYDANRAEAAGFQAYVSVGRAPFLKRLKLAKSA